ncbi:hypothetical protein G6514_006780 [Epicoccum nigrum]|nr:hypothetical protein G6514_006780 [Epicoccum nigrum]
MQNDNDLCIKNKVFVTSTKDGEQRPTIFTNYIRANDSDSHTDAPFRPLYDFETLRDKEMQFKVWEVARATSAAPTYFRSFSKGSSEQYWDGGLCYNNPASVARDEIFKIWPKMMTEHPDVLLSIGSGYQSTDTKQSQDTTGWWERITGWVPTPGGMKMLETLKRTLLKNMDSEEAWRKEAYRYQQYQARYFRMSPECKVSLPELDDLKAFDSGMLESLAEEWLKESHVLVETLVRRLFATSFYFKSEQKAENTDRGREFSGQIGCRFLDGSDDLVNFLEALQTRVKVLRFRLEETQEYLGGFIDEALFDTMKKEKVFRFDIDVFTVPKEFRTFTIVLESDIRGKFPKTPISGCPWKLQEAAAMSL